MHKSAKDLTGQRFNRLIALGDSGERSKERGVIWLCQCDCGNITKVQASSLRGGHTKSCGCLQKEKARATLFKHGGWGTRLHTTWNGIRYRCSAPNNPLYKYYGKKGIKVCSLWENDFLSFKNWALENGYNDDLTIDRINHWGDYEPSNCQWLTRSENAKKAVRDRKSRGNLS